MAFRKLARIDSTEVAKHSIEAGLIERSEELAAMHPVAKGIAAHPNHLDGQATCDLVRCRHQFDQKLGARLASPGQENPHAARGDVPNHQRPNRFGIGFFNGITKYR